MRPDLLRWTGSQEARYDIVGENLLAEHGNSSIAFDGEGRLYVLNMQLAHTGSTPRATKGRTPRRPDLRPCLPPLVNAPRSPIVLDLPPLPNDIAFAPSGDAYVTGSMQATIWRIPKTAARRRSGFRAARSARRTSGPTACA